jgi:hypothetical protein
MNPKIEVIKLKVGSDKDLEKYRYEMKKFAETHKIVSVITAMDIQALVIYATILYEGIQTK